MSVVLDGRRYFATFLFLLACLLVSEAGHQAVAAEKPGIDWQVAGRFRLLTNVGEGDRFLNGVFAAGTKANVFADLFKVNRFDLNQNFNFVVASGWDQASAQYREEWFVDQHRRLRVRVFPAALREAGLSVAAAARAVCVFTVDGEARGTGPCRSWTVVDAHLGKLRLGWRLESEAAPRETEVEIKDIKIASIGDSYSSGEGNPLTAWISRQWGRAGLGMPATWLDDRCHRSILSGPALAAARLALANPQASVTFVSYACSGAEISPGVLTPYVGRESAAQVKARYDAESRIVPNWLDGAPNLPTQIEALTRLLCKSPNPCTKLDALIIGTGGNEVGFGTIVRMAYQGQLGNDRSRRAVRARLQVAFTELKRSFERLGEALVPISPARTLLVTYLDPTKDENGKPCSSSVGRPAIWPILDFLGIAHISKAESAFVATDVLFRLDELHREIAHERGWVFVGDFSRRHGFCAKDPYFRAYQEDWNLQGLIPDDPANGVKGGFPSGVMHPNVYGHLHVSGRIFDALH